MSASSIDREPLIELTHAVFHSLHPVLFRRTEDAQAVMVVSLGAEDAVLPLRALRREFGIAEDSADGRMLTLIEQSLEYVAGLRLGDPLPPEVLGEGGSGGFEPTLEHQRRAARRVQAALEQGMSPRAAATAMAELAAVECLRTTLIERVTSFRESIETLARANRGEGQRALEAGQVARLARVADGRLGKRFAALDGVDTRTLLQAPDAVLPAMRAGRDVLHRNRLAWTPTLDAWDRAPGWPGAEDWPLIERTYRFLAPRYMSTSEWQARFCDRHVAADGALAQMIW